MPRQKKTDTDLSTEEKIKEAARKVFTRKGYAATRTRDIAEEAGINLALLNYYFRSKEKLFHQVMVEKVQQLFSVIAPVVNNSSISLESKISRIAESYIDMLLKHPDLPIFVLSELRNNVPSFMNIVHPEKLIRNSSLVTQLKKARPDINPLHFLANILGMVLFPFIAQPVFVATLALDARQFKQMMEERKQLIPAWVKAMLKTK